VFPTLSRPTLEISGEDSSGSGRPRPLHLVVRRRQDLREKDTPHQFFSRTMASISFEQHMQRVGYAERLRYPAVRVGTRCFLLNVVKSLIEVSRPRSVRVDLLDLLRHFDRVRARCK
jgi:hypothetical protein